MFEYIRVNTHKNIYLKGYKCDYDSRYNEEKYLQWLLDKVNFDRMEISA